MGSFETAAEDTVQPGAAQPENGEREKVPHESTARELLVRKLIDIVVLPAARISANERSLAADTLLQVIDKVEIELRIEIARRIARLPEAPPVLVRMLLLDEPEVAGPILQGAEFLPEALLIEAARLGTTAHRDMITRRLDLTSALADVIVEANEPDVTKLLLRREEYSLSPSAVDILVSRSPNDRELQALLLRRRELEPAHGFMMFWWVDSERRRRILSRFALDRSVIQDALRDLYPRTFREGATPDPFVKEILTMLDRRHRPRGLDGETVSMDVVKRTLAVSRECPAEEVILAVGMIAGISRNLSARILRDPGGEPYAVMCKSLGIPRDEFFAFLTEVSDDSDNKISLQAAEHLLAVFDSMPRDFSRAVLRYWDWTGNPRIARISHLLGVEADPEEVIRKVIS